MPQFDSQFERVAEAMHLDTRNPVAIRARIEVLERLLERSFVVPGINRTVGLDAIIGLVPGIGDIITAAMGAYIVWEGRNLGMSKWQLWRMAGNVGFDALLGAVPVVGDAADFLFRSNSRNVKLIKKHLDRHHPASATVDGQASASTAAVGVPDLKRIN